MLYDKLFSLWPKSIQFNSITIVNIYWQRSTFGGGVLIQNNEKLYKNEITAAKQISGNVIYMP